MNVRTSFTALTAMLTLLFGAAQLNLSAKEIQDKCHKQTSSTHHKKKKCHKKARADRLKVKKTAQICGDLHVGNTINADQINANSITTNDLTVNNELNADTIHANTVVVNDILDLSNAVVIEPQNPALGWWGSAVKGNSQAGWFMHVEQNLDKTLFITVYGGTPLTARELPPGNNLIGAFGTNPNPSTQLSDKEIVFGQAIPFPLWYSELNGTTFRIQDDNPDIAYLATLDMPEGKLPFEFYHVNKWYRLAEAPEIIRFDAAPFDDYTNPISIYENTFEALMYAVSNQNAVDLEARDYPGFAKINAIKDKIRDEGIETHTTVSTVWPTLKATATPTALGNNPITTYATTLLADNALATTAGSANIVITHPSHGLATGHFVMLSGAEAVGGIVPEQINTYAARQGLAITVLNANQYRITARGPADVAAIGGGSNVRVHSFSVKVNHPAHGFTTGTAVSVSGSCGVMGIPSSDINTNQLVTRIDDNNYLIPVLFEATAAGQAGGSNIQVARITIPAASIRSTIRPLFTTTIFTNQWHNAMRGAKIEICGFTEEYAKLNGHWRLSLVENRRDNRDAKTVYSPDHVNPHSIKYQFNIDVDTSDLPVYDPSIHGTAKVKVAYGPVRADSEYFETVGACYAVMNAFAYGTHTTPFSIIDTYTQKEADTWQQVAEIVKGGVFTLAAGGTRDSKPGRFFYSGLNRTALTVQSALFNNLPDNAISGNSIDQTKRIDRTNPLFARDITRQNYLDADKTFNIYWRIKPNGATNPSPLHASNFQTSLLGYNANGVEFEFTISKYGVTPSGVVIPAGAVIATDPAGWRPIDNDITVHIGGMVKDSLSSGKKIAYIRSANTVGTDPQGLMRFTDWTPKGNKLTDNITHLSNNIRKWLPLMTEFMKNNPDKIIIDIRDNGGGNFYHQFALASFIGGNRPGVTLVTTPATNGNQPTQTLQDLENSIQTVFGNTSAIAAINATVPADDTAADYPEAVFRGAGKKLVFLDSVNAFSGGDTFPHVFRGTAQNPQDLGAGVQSILVGNIDGSIAGSRSGAYFAPLTTTHNLLALPSDFGNGSPIAGFSLNGEYLNSRKQSDDAPSWVNQLPETAPDVLLDQWVTETVWQDVGAEPLSSGRLTTPWTSMPNGGQPVLNDNTSWRDRWMEEAIKQ